MINTYDKFIMFDIFGSSVLPNMKHVYLKFCNVY